MNCHFVFAALAVGAFGASGEVGECAAKLGEEDVVSLLQNQLTTQEAGAKKNKRDQSHAKHLHGILGDLDKQLEQEVKSVAKLASQGRSRQEVEKQMAQTIRDMSEEQKNYVRNGLFADQSRRSKIECMAARGATAAYKDSASGELFDSTGARQDLKDLGWEYKRSFNKSEGSEWDHMGWYNNAGKCMFTFQGSNDDADYLNNHDHTATSVYGVPGIHRGVANELTPLVNQFIEELPTIEATCTKPVIVTGHSLGGALAQVFSLVLTSADSTITHNLKLGGLYSFGAMSVGEVNAGNDEAEDKCFPGEQYWNARPGTAERNSLGNTEVDILRSEATGGTLLEPIKSHKKLLFNPVRQEGYECGTKIPNTFKGSGYDLHMMPTYEFNLGCITLTQYTDAVNKMMAQYR